MRDLIDLPEVHAKKSRVILLLVVDGKAELLTQTILYLQREENI